jgi:DNA invertase Pin-like site-specific DNA recombinase
VTLIGYARVSTADQEPRLQVDALRDAGCEVLFVERASGAMVDRPQLALCLEALRTGDTLVVWKLDRLGRSLRHLVTLIPELNARGVQLRSLTEAFDTATPAGRMVLGFLAVLAQFERELIQERTRAGLEAARRRGRRPGRHRVISERRLQVARELIGRGQSVAEVAKMIGAARTTLYDALRRSPEADPTAAPGPGGPTG